MKAIHNNSRELLNDCVIVALLTGTIGIALKFTTFFDKWVYFPSFPNVCDAAFLILSVGYLTWKAKSHKVPKRTQDKKPELQSPYAKSPNPLDF